MYRWALKWVPFFAFFQRFVVNVWVMRYGQRLATDGSDMNDDMSQKAVEYMESQIKDPKLREILRPNAKYYSKRPLALDNFYSSLAKPNCTVVRDTLVSYTEAGVLSRDAATKNEIDRAFDVIIFGTGFNVANYLEHEIIHGINGVSLQDKWKEHPESLYGLATNQFPNMFMCFGPNSATVWSSQQDIWEH
ncbi:hypothetical protein LTR93_011591 [Exophiala xenobiotica]|nr:hypothetical protein LTR93_011591 [Exophiala xenobiotica]